jgi:hypothetical protein
LQGRVKEESSPIFRLVNRFILESEISMAIKIAIMGAGCKIGTIPIPPTTRGPSGVDIYVYCGDWLVGAVECKKSWPISKLVYKRSDSNYNSGWRLIYGAIGQLLLHGRANTRCGYRRVPQKRFQKDVKMRTYAILKSSLRKEVELPVAIATGRSNVSHDQPRLADNAEVEQFIRESLSELNIHLILCSDNSAVREFAGLAEFLDEVYHYSNWVLAEMNALYDDYLAAMEFLNNLPAVPDMIITDRDERGLSACLKVIETISELWTATGAHDHDFDKRVLLTCLERESPTRKTIVDELYKCINKLIDHTKQSILEGSQGIARMERMRKFAAARE